MFSKNGWIYQHWICFKELQEKNKSLNFTVKSQIKLSAPLLYISNYFHLFSDCTRAALWVCWKSLYFAFCLHPKTDRLQELLHAWKRMKKYKVWARRWSPAQGVVVNLGDVKLPSVTSQKDVYFSHLWFSSYFLQRQKGSKRGVLCQSGDLKTSVGVASWRLH